MNEVFLSDLLQAMARLVVLSQSSQFQERVIVGQVVGIIKKTQNINNSINNVNTNAVQYIVFM